MRIANKAAASMVANRRPFEGSNLFARETHVVQSETTLYVVYSYGEHFPMYIAETTADNVTHWYANTDRYSQSTTRHQSQARPNINCIPMTTEQMRLIAKGGLMELVRRGLA